MPRQQKARKPKTSSGSGIKHKKNPQTAVALILMNKGMYRNIAKKVSTGS